MMVWIFLVGVASGIISGMGIGGGAILIPALLILFDLGQKEAQAVNLIYFIPAALAALYKHNKNGNIEKKAVKPIVLIGLLGAAAGAALAIWLDSGILKRLFGFFLVFMGLREVFYKAKDEKKEDTEYGTK